MDGEYERHVFTTMFDLYALPDDFPGYEAAKAIGEPYARVAALETAFAEAINDSRFIPYIQLHELKLCSFAVLTIWQSVTPVVRNAANS